MIPKQNTGSRHPVHPAILSKASRLPADRMNGIHRMPTIVPRSVQGATCGADGSSADQRVRKDQLSRLMRRDDALFDDLDSRYYKSTEVIQVFACRFVLGHPEAFR